MDILYTAFVLGLMGSFHCVGMCGPIAISLPLRGHNFVQKTTGGFLYNLGRTFTYGVMGAFFGLIGQGFHFLGFQQSVSIIMGCLMILSVLLPFLFRKRIPVNFEFFTGSLRRSIQQLFRVRSYRGLFLIGLLNGLLPCGLVYLAIAGAIGTGGVLPGILFMVLFGLGTLPMMLLVSGIGNMISLAVRNKMSKVVPYVVVVIGIIFILRGLSLGIPFLSPPAEKLNPSSHMKKPEMTNPVESVKRACCQTDTLLVK
ncbi:MAG: sulfite exporter TauE/SafE family protein [Mariniphaga sp.]